MGYIDIMPYSLEHNSLPNHKSATHSNFAHKKIRRQFALDAHTGGQAKAEDPALLDRTNLQDALHYSTGAKYNVSALPSPDSTPTIIRIPTPSSESSLPSPPLEMEIGNLEISDNRTPQKKRTVLPTLCSPDFPRSVNGSPKSLPSLDVVMAYTRDRTDLPPPAKPQEVVPLPTTLPLQRGRWLWVNQQNVEGSHRPQVQQYMRERPREWGRLNQLAYEASRQQRELEAAEQRAEERARAEAAAAVLPSTPRNSTRVNRPRQPSNKTKESAGRPTEERRVSTNSARRPRKRSIPDDNQTTPKRKKAAPSENKVKYDTWQQIAHWFGIFPEIPQSQTTREYVNTHRSQMFAGFQPGGTLTEPKRMNRKDPNIHLLCEFEIEFCERLGWDTNKFLIHKLRLFHANFMELKKNPGKPFNKTRAQQSGQCDVNNMSRFFEVYSYTGLLSNAFIQDSVLKGWDEDAAAATMKRIGVAALEDATTAPAAKKELRDGDRNLSKQPTMTSLTSPPATGTNNSPVSVLGSVTSPSIVSGSTGTPNILTPGESNSSESPNKFQASTSSNLGTFPNGGKPSLADPIYTDSDASASQPRNLFPTA